ncbi:MAG: hypothetical protein RLZZ543_1373 [Bacteroidota bacterium]
MRSKKFLFVLFILFSTSAFSQSTALDWYNQGTAKGLTEDFTGAIECFSKAILLQPDFEDALYNRGLCLFRKRQYKAALADFNAILDKNIESARSYNQRGLTRSALGDQNGAINDISDAIILQPNEPNYYYNRAISRYALGLFAEALADLNVCIEFDPKLAKAYYKRGIIQYVSGSKEAGCVDLGKSADLGYADAFDIIRVYCR